jgi:hypothetical protein
LFNTFLKKEISFFEAFGRLALWISGANGRVSYHIAGAFVSFVVCMSHIVTKKIKIHLEKNLKKNKNRILFFL